MLFQFTERGRVGARILSLLQQKASKVGVASGRIWHQFLVTNECVLGSRRVSFQGQESRAVKQSLGTVRIGLLQGIKDLLSLVQRLTRQRAGNRLKPLLCSRALSGRGQARRPECCYKNQNRFHFSLPVISRI